MRFSDSDLRAASAAGVLDAPQLARLMDFLQARGAPSAAAKFGVAHLLWYAGALIVIGAMGLFSTLAFSRMGGAALTATAIAYAAAFGLAGHHLWANKGLRVPGGLLIAIAVTMAPLAVYGIQDALGTWGAFGRPGTLREFYIWIKGGWLFMELAAIAAAVVALRFYRFPFIVSIIAVALWFMSMDLAPWIDNMAYATFETRRKLSVAFGLAVLAVAWIVDTRQRDGDFAFWLHLFGLMAFWGGISMANAGSELAKALYCAMNVGLLALSLFLGRRAYAVFGVLGIAGYLGYLADRVFKDSLMFPFALSLIGVGVIAAGLAYHRHEAAIAAFLDARLPDWVRRLRPAHTG
jgi:hypothetical protein